MPRRTSTRAVTSSATSEPHLPETPEDSNLLQLRRHWTWAAFCQFFFTFNSLFSLNDVTLGDVENDLVHSTNRVLPRIMQRLLISLTQDRKITTDNWQNALRRQYQRRDPDASPIGLPSRPQGFIIESSRASTAPPIHSGPPSEVPPNEPKHEDESLEHDQSVAQSPESVAHVDDPEQNSSTKIEDQENAQETYEEPEKQVDWLDLPMLTKLESLHTLAEWQFQNPHRLRQQMKSDDELASWRIEPIGYDVKRNAYWFIGGDRLWIQREPPRVTLKRKRKPGGGGNSRNKTREQIQPPTAKRQRIDSEPKATEHSPFTHSSTRKAQSQSSPGGTKEGRAAKTRANQRLDAQAKDLAEFQRQMAGTRTRGASAQTLRRPTGIRVSARLRGAQVEEDEWQEVPDDWLAASDTHKSKSKSEDAQPGPSPAVRRMKTGLESDDSSVSELTELSDGEDEAPGTDADSYIKVELETEKRPPQILMDDEQLAVNPPEPAEIGDEEGQKVQSPQSEATPPPPDDFIEWETICVTLEEWESIGERFARATHYAEKSLHKALSQSIVPVVTAELREIAKKRRLEEAVVHRKRSTRIAMKETEKEEERAVMRRRAEEEEKMSRARRLEARQQREQAERFKRETAREQRRKERELREQQAAETQEAASRPDVSVDVGQDKSYPNPPPVGESQVILNASLANGTGGGSRSPVENWELDCEICGRKGINQDDGVPLLCCGVCSKWQHIVCHDKQDATAGLPKRNWDAEDFICRQCRLIRAKASSPSSSTNLIYPSGTQVYYGQPSNHSRTYPNSGYYQDSPSNGRYPYDQSDVRTSAPLPSSHSYTPHSRSGGVTFAHYQPQQGGFSTSRPTYSVQDAQQHQPTRYAVTPQSVPAGVASYPSTFHTQAVAQTSPIRPHEQWPSSSYPRTGNPCPMNGTPQLHAQGVQPYHNGHATNGVSHMSYSHMRGTNSQAMGQYAGLQHITSYQHNK